MMVEKCASAVTPICYSMVGVFRYMVVDRVKLHAVIRDACIVWQ